MSRDPLNNNISLQLSGSQAQYLHFMKHREMGVGGGTSQAIEWVGVVPLQLRCIQGNLWQYMSCMQRLTPNWTSCRWTPDEVPLPLLSQAEGLLVWFWG